MTRSSSDWATESPLIVKNKLSVTCILFTGITLAASTLGMATEGFGSTSDNFHIWSRFAIVVVAIGSLYLFDWLQSWPLRVVHAVHYLATMAIILVAVWLAGFAIDLHPDAYRDIFLNYTGVYLILVVVEYGYFRWRGRKRALRAR